MPSPTGSQLIVATCLKLFHAPKLYGKTNGSLESFLLWFAFSKIQSSIPVRFLKIALI